MDLPTFLAIAVALLIVLSGYLLLNDGPHVRQADGLPPLVAPLASSGRCRTSRRTSIPAARSCVTVRG